MKTTDQAILPDISVTYWNNHTQFHANTLAGEAALREVDRNFVSSYGSTGKTIFVHRSYADEVHRLLKTLVSFNRQWQP